MLNLGTQEPDSEKAVTPPDRDEDSITLSEVFAQRGSHSLSQQRATYYTSGLWPFRRVSFECPGCNRWLSIKSVHAGRVGLCPSCDLTISAPDPTDELPPALVSRTKTSPGSQEVGLEGDPEAEPGVNGLSPDNKRDLPVVGDEANWGLNNDNSLVPIHVVSRLMNVLPWAGVALILALAFGVGYWFTVSNQTEPIANIAATEAERAKAAEQANPRPAVRMSSQLWVVLDTLATAENVEEMASLVRRPDEMLPKMRAYYEDNRVRLPHSFERARPGLKIYDIKGTSFARFEGRCDGRPVKFAFEWTDHGWRLDWESLIGYSETSWEQYLAERPDEPRQFRVLMKVSRGEGLEFDRDKYVCLLLEDHLSTGRAHALVERSGEVGFQLKKFFQLHAQGSEPRTWITPVVAPHGGSEELLEVVELKSGSWLIP